jgi:hypothetical protein
MYIIYPGIYVWVSMADDWNASSSKENSTRHVSYFHWRPWFGYLIPKNGKHTVRQWELMAMYRKQNLNIFETQWLAFIASIVNFCYIRNSKWKVNHKFVLCPKLWSYGHNLSRGTRFAGGLISIRCTAVEPLRYMMKVGIESLRGRILMPNRGN